MRNSGFLFFLFCLVFTGNAQMVHVPVTTAYTRLGAYTLRRADAFSFTANQAALANVAAVSGGVYGERLFLLQELALYKTAFVLPTPSGNFGLTATYAGSTSYNETGIGLAYGRKLGSKLDIGAQFNYNSIKASTYGTASALNFEAGLLLHLSDAVQVGVHAYNPTGARLGKNAEEKLPAVYTAGVGYEASENFFVSAEIQKVEDQELGVNGGMQYNFDEKLFARGGFTSGSASYYLGFGVQLQSFRIDATATIHPQLGVTPGLLLLFKGKDPKK